MTPDTVIPTDLMPTPERRIGDEAIGISIVASGQPRSYADHHDIVRVQFVEWSYQRDEAGHIADFSAGAWTPADLSGYERRDPADEWNEVQAQQVEKALVVGGARHLKPRHLSEWHESYLDYIREVGPGCYEIRTVRPYID